MDEKSLVRLLVVIGMITLIINVYTSAIFLAEFEKLFGISSLYGF